MCNNVYIPSILFHCQQKNATLVILYRGKRIDKTVAAELMSKEEGLSYSWNGHTCTHTVSFTVFLVQLCYTEYLRVYNY